MVDRARLIRIGLVTLGAVVACIILFMFLTRGWVGITAPKDASIVITDSKEQIVGRGTSSYNSPLPIGDYMVTVSNSDNSTRKQITVKRFSITSVSLTVRTATQAQPITNLNISNLAVAGDELYFVDPDTRYLSSITADGTYKTLPETVVNTVQWRSGASGIAITPTFDGQKQLVTIDKTIIKPVTTPFMVDDNTSMAQTVDGAVYVLQNNQLLRGANISGIFEKIADTASGSNVLATIGDNVVTSTLQYEKFVYELRVIDTKGKIIGSVEVPTIESPNYGFSIKSSPSHSALLVTSAGHMFIYDEHLKLTHTLPEIKANSASWNSEDELIYGYENKLWRYSLTDNQSEAVAALPSDYSLRDIYVGNSPNEYYLYAVSNGHFGLFKTTGTNQSPDKTASTLATSNTTTLTDTCQIHFVAIASPRIIARAYPIDMAECRGSIAEYLRSISVSQSLPIQEVTPSDSHYYN